MNKTPTSIRHSRKGGIGLLAEKGLTPKERWAMTHETIFCPINGCERWLCREGCPCWNKERLYYPTYATE